MLIFSTDDATHWMWRFLAIITFSMPFPSNSRLSGLWNGSILMLLLLLLLPILCVNIGIWISASPIFGRLSCRPLQVSHRTYCMWIESLQPFVIYVVYWWDHSIWMPYTRPSIWKPFPSPLSFFACVHIRIILSLTVILCWPSFHITAHVMHTIKMEKEISKKKK